MNAVIEVEGLRKEYRRLRGKPRVALDGLDLSVPEGGVFGFLGPNGSGKTTTIRCLLGLVRPTGGHASVLGASVPTGLPDVISQIGSIVETPTLFPTMTGRRNLSLLGRLDGHGPRAVDAVLHRVGLAERADDLVKTYSLGMKQRLGLAAALLKDPALLILDEPANGLDPEGMKWLRGFLRAQAAKGRTVLISSHVLAEIEQTVDHVLIISKGKLLAQGPIAQLAAGAAAVVRVRSPQAQRLEDLLLQKGAGVNRLETALAIRGPSSAEVGELAHANDIVLHELFTEQPSLEDLFLQIAGTRRES